MVAPRIQLSLVDPGASGRPVNTDQIPVYVGIAAAGSVAEVKTFTRASQLVSEYTRGHLVDVGSHHLAVGNRQVKVLRVAATTPGAATIDDAGPANMTLSAVSGTPTQFLDVRIECVTGGLISGGTCAVRYTLDDFNIPNLVPTWSPTVLIPASGVLQLADTGLAANFEAADTPVAGDDVKFTTVPGEYDATTIAAATTLMRAPIAGDYTFWCFAGDTSTAAEANTIAVAIEGEILESFNAARFHGAMTFGGLETASALVTALAATSIEPPFLSMGYGAAYVQNPTNAVARSRLALREHEIAAAKVSTDLISTDPGRTLSGPLRRVVGTSYDAQVEGDTLHDARVAVLRSYQPASEGLFIQRQRLLSASNSDFRSWQDAAIMIQGLRAAHRVAFGLILELLRNTAANTLAPAEIADIQSAVDAELARVLLQPLNVRGQRGHVSAARSEVSNSVELPAVNVTIRIRRFGYAEDLQFTLQYANDV